MFLFVKVLQKSVKTNQKTLKNYLIKVGCLDRQ